MKKSKRIQSSILCLSLIGLIVSGCSNNSKNEAQPSAPSGANSGDKPATQQQPMNVMFWAQKPEKVSKDSYSVKSVEKQFNVNIDIKPRNNETYREKLLLDIASGQTPDWFNDQNFADYDKFVDQGVVAEIPPSLIEKYAPKYTQWLKKSLGDNPFRYTMRNGKNYSMPIMWSLGPKFESMGIRKDWLDKAGIAKVPETLDELEAAMIKFKENNVSGDKNGTYPLTGTFPDLFNPVFGAFGVYPGIFTEDNGKVVRGEIEPGAKEALKVLARWYKEGLIDPEFVVNKYNNVDDKIISEKSGVVTNAWWNFLPADAFTGGDYFEKLRAKNPNAAWAVIGAPKGPDGKKGTVQINPVVSSGLQFGKQLEKDQAKMIKYIQIFEATNFDSATYEKVHFGEEGVTYKKNNGDIEWIPPYDKEDQRDKYGVGDAIQFPGSFNDYDFQKPYMTKSKYMDLRNETEAKSAGKYDILDPIQKPIYNEYKDRLTQLTNKAFVDFITGKRSIDEFDKFVDEWKKTGGDKVMEEAKQKYEQVFKS